MTAAHHSFDAPIPDLNDKSVLVTGGTGSFGRAFVKTVLADFSPRRLIVFSRDEQKQYEMAREYSTQSHPSMRYFIGDVRDTDRLELAMREVDYVVHAAALKHIPTAEYNPFYWELYRKVPKPLDLIRSRHYIVRTRRRT